MPFASPPPALALPLTFHPKPGKNLLWLAISACFLLLGGWMSLRGDSRGSLVGTVFALLFFVFLLRLIPNSSFLRIDHEGFTVRSLFRSHFTAWADVDRFLVIDQKSYGITTNRFVGYNYSKNSRRLKAVRTFNRWFTDAEAMFEPMGMKAPEQAAILNECLLRYRQGQLGPR